MAKVTAQRASVSFALELTEAEAKYVAAALLKTDPADGSTDTVYEALTTALDDAGVEWSGDDAMRA